MKNIWKVTIEVVDNKWIIQDKYKVDENYQFKSYGGFSDLSDIEEFGCSLLPYIGPIKEFKYILLLNIYYKGIINLPRKTFVRVKDIDTISDDIRENINIIRDEIIKNLRDDKISELLLL